MINKKNIFWMKYAIFLSKIAEKKGEIPVGAVLILNEKIIGQGWNSTISHNDPTSHAEILALRQGGKKIKNYRLLNSELYVTLEPCIMCLGAINNARIKKIFFGAKNNQYKNKNQIYLAFNHKILKTTSILGKVCSLQLKNFFKKKRKCF